MADVPAVTTNMLTNKVGPLPMWGWMGIGLLGAIAFSAYRSSKSGSTTTKSSTLDADTDMIPGSNDPPIVFQNFDTNIWQPPSGGRVTPPTAPPIGSLPGGTTTTTPPATTTAPTAPATGQTVKVAKFTTKNPPWNSTLSGIAAKLYGNQALWTKIWNAPQNAALKARRKDPKYIQPGDSIYVPAK